MKNKKLLISLILVLALVLTLGLTACGGGDDDCTHVDANSDGTCDKCNEKMPGGGDGEEANLSTRADKVKPAIDTARQANGVKISYEITSSDSDEKSTITFAAKGDKYYFETDGDEVIYDLSSDTQMVKYAKEKGDAKWTKTAKSFDERTAKTAIDAAFTGVATFMTSYSAYAKLGTGFVNKGTEQISGYACAKYSYAYAFGGDSAEFNYWINEETGICFKMSASGTVDGETGSGTFTLKEFVKNYEVVIPTAEQIIEEECFHYDIDNDGLCDECGADMKGADCDGHVDEDSDGYCDNCGALINAGGGDGNDCPNHVDTNGDGYCDNCNGKMDGETKCETHEDDNNDGTCDRCGADMEKEGDAISDAAEKMGASIEAARKADGIKISYEITDYQGSTDTMTYGANGDKYYFVMYGEERIFDLTSNIQMVLYTRSEGDEKWSKLTVKYSEDYTKEAGLTQIEAAYDNISAYMTKYTEYVLSEGDFTVGGTETITGYTCTKYTYSVTCGDDNAENSYWIDAETGLCFKYAFAATINGLNSSMSFTLKEFNESYQIVVPTADQIAECEHVDYDEDGLCDYCGEDYVAE